MVLERFKNGDPVPVYRRFREQRRLAPGGPNHVGRGVRADLASCWQIISSAEASDRMP